MFVDIKEKTRIKYCLRDLEGDARATAHKYATEGYDVVSLLKKGAYIPETSEMIPACLYKIGNPDSTDGEFTLVGLGMTSPPDIPEDWENMIKTSSAKCAEAIRQIHQKNGYAVLCNVTSHKNTAEQILRLEGLDAIEVCNRDAGEDGESAALCDILANSGMVLGIIASGSEFLGSICVEALEAEAQSIVRGLKAGRYFSSEGDSEIHIYSLPSGKIKVDCSPSSRIEFFSNLQDRERVKIEGENLISAEYIPVEGEKYVRAEITDMQGLDAWSTYIEV